ncbi:hypothetical protein HELRODRAFT_107164 [Helobdella robusta]|uniref:Laminin subunit beta-1 n=1 Tax=Helobdella robusta TaxID=6412 RepID=T1EE82_HELRO|nr:hypothetical protein HELRODRAFT_107164 [Helobdella robusta]ESN99117.1 hypothetical protein HELRODRAFT_107164 [Helobdella robusta]
MIGRQHRLSASSTCGLQKVETYCIFSGLDRTVNRNKCFLCDSRNPNNPRSHRVENIISRYRKDWESRWWQSENGVHNVSLQLDLEAEFHFTFLTAKFKSIRPAGMVIERSYDFGKTWKVYKYFSTNCTRLFPNMTIGQRSHHCDEKQTKMFPSSKGEIYFAPIQNSSLKIYSKEMQNLLKVTNLRINFTKLHSLDDQFLTTQSNIKHFYAVYQLTIQGRCSCYGHADTCSGVPGEKNNIDGKVHAKCECAHFTTGHNCEQCMDFYNNLPWRPATKDNSNACQKCNCNMHSMKCHFDPVVYVISNLTSGGICDDCQHNTQGYNCEQCKPFFYHDPGRPITDPYACQSCNCDPRGSLYKGECEPKNNFVLDLAAGHCHCKENVEGTRCDTCKQGFAKLSDDHPLGCEACDCHPIGTSIEEGTCNQFTGECKCKRFVTGKQCDKCRPGYWNFGKQPQGCTPCDCDIGGAADWNCNQMDGGCTCRPNIIGRYCNEVPSKYFVPGLDYLIYEGEFADGIGRYEVENREIYEGGYKSWTGTGFMRVYEGSSIDFHVKGIPYSTHYDVIVRYETPDQGTWHDVTLYVMRSEPTKLGTHCGNVIHTDQNAPVEISDRFRHYILIHSTCLEQGSEHKIRINFNKFSPYETSPDKFVLVDSIVLVPSADQHPTMQFTELNNIRNDYERYGCINHYLSPAYQWELPAACRKLIFSASAYIHDGAQACDCDPVGSEDPECDAIGGQCRCKPNVVGRRCDQCEYAHYGFGPNGCSRCKCNMIGSLDNNCNVTTGQCKCIQNAYGLRCSECQRGFFGYPHCRPCQCNGMSDDCDGETGQCLACRDNTGGHNCERCADGYYGDPRTGGCKPCMCPGGAGSGAQHARTCHQDPSTGTVICHCDEGYSGYQCDRCTQNYFGDPLISGGTCQQCLCNGNIDLSVPDSCDSTTGECLKCLYNTIGYSCNRCRQGYYGDAVQKTCKPCECSALGTNKTLANDCDHVTGQCHCLPNVVARKCDQCEINHWRLYGGDGCIPCDCDPTGSLMEQCDVFQGQCPCKTGRGGRDCSECPAYHWGSPAIGCKPCSCNPDGSTSRQCDKLTGQCKCQKGVTGLKCDRCDRGTTGQLPHCQPCGECFDNYDVLIHDLEGAVIDVNKQVYDMRLSEKNKAYRAEFNDIEDDLNDLDYLVHHLNASHTEKFIAECVDEEFKNKTKEMEKMLIAKSGDNEAHDHQFQTLVEKFVQVNQTFEKVKHDNNDLLGEVKFFEENAIYEQEQNVEGAHKSILESMNSVEVMEAKVPSLKNQISWYAGEVQKKNEGLDHFDDQKKADAEDGNDDYDDAAEVDHMAAMEKEINKIKDQILDLNFETCGGQGKTCDDKCGGANCKTCGDDNDHTCTDGSVTKSVVAFKSFKESEGVLGQLVKQANSLTLNLSQISKNCTKSEQEVKKLAERSKQARSDSESNLSNITSLQNEAKEFMEKEKELSDDIKKVYNDTMSVSLEIYEPRLKELSEQIKTAAQSLEDVRQITVDTKQDQEASSRAAVEASRVLNDSRRLHGDLEKGLKDMNDLMGVDDLTAMVETLTNDSMKFKEDVNALFDKMRELRAKSSNSTPRVYNINARLDKVKKSIADRDSLIKLLNDKRLRIEKKKVEVKKRLDAYNELNDQLTEKWKLYDQNFEINKSSTKNLLNRTDEIKKNVFSSRQALEVARVHFDEFQMTAKEHNKLIKTLLERIHIIRDEIQTKSKIHFLCR